MMDARGVPETASPARRDLYTSIPDFLHFINTIVGHQEVEDVVEFRQDREQNQRATRERGDCYEKRVSFTMVKEAEENRWRTNGEGKVPEEKYEIHEGDRAVRMARKKIES